MKSLLLMFNRTGFVGVVVSFPATANTVGGKTANFLVHKLVRRCWSGEVHGTGLPGQRADA